MNAPVQTNFSIPEVNPQQILSVPAKRKIVTVTLLFALCQQVLLLLIPILMKLVINPSYKWKFVFMDNLMQWDAQWLIGIAKHGYTNIAHTAFFPMYPVVVRVVHMMTGMGYYVSAFFASLAALLVAAYVLGLWTYEQFDSRTSILTIALLFLFPTSFYYRAGYTESMFLCFSILAVYSSSHKKFTLAGLFVTLAALTRNTGLLLGIILMMDYVSYRKMGWKFWRYVWWRNINARVLGLFIPILGLSMYFTWLKIHTGLFLPFLQAEKVWHRTFAFPWVTVEGSILQLFKHQELTYLPYHLLELTSLGIVCAAMWYGVRHARHSSHQLGNWLYMVLVLWVCTSAPARTGHQWDYLLSMPRFVLMMYPAFAYLASRMQSKTSIVLVFTTSILGFCILYGTYCSGAFIA